MIFYQYNNYLVSNSGCPLPLKVEDLKLGGTATQLFKKLKILLKFLLK